MHYLCLSKFLIIKQTIAEFAVPIITGVLGLIGNIVQGDRNNNEANLQRDMEICKEIITKELIKWKMDVIE